MERETPPDGRYMKILISADPATDETFDYIAAVEIRDGKEISIPGLAENLCGDISGEKRIAEITRVKNNPWCIRYIGGKKVYYLC